MELRKKLAWISVLYFASGLPLGFVYDVLPVYLRVHGVSLKEIGLMSLLSLPWTWKAIWAPLVDRYGMRQIWITACLAGLSAATFVFAPLDASNPGFLMWIVLISFTMASATQDVAIDAYAVDISTPKDSGVINGVRVSAYRVAMLAGGGGMVFLAGYSGWEPLWIALAAVFACLSVLSFLSPRVPIQKKTFKEMAGPLAKWILRKDMIPVVLFVLLFKVGDSTLGRMVKPFWVDKGLTLQEIGLISTTLGVVLTIAGALAGGWFTTRFGIFQGLLWLGVSQAVSNLGYVAVAALDLPRESIYVASVIESFTQGLGTAAFLSFLMNLCERQYAATQYALLSALFAFSRDVAGAFSGLGVEKLGYASYFAFTTALAIPGLLLLIFIRPKIREMMKSRGESERAGVTGNG